VLRIKLRAGLLGLMAMLLVGSFAAATAEAQGPFWYHRELQGQGSQGKGVKISSQQWEEVRGGGGEARLEAKEAFGLKEVLITSKQVQIKGIIYNNDQQGQAKLEFVYEQPTLVKPESKCTVTIGKNNVVKVFGHLAWTWNGELKQLEEQPQLHQTPDWLFTGQELQQEAKELPKGVPFTTIALTGSNCIANGITRAVTGSVAATIEPSQLGFYGTEQKSEALPNGTFQHFQNGLGVAVGAKTGLFLGENEATLKQTNQVKTYGRQQKTQQAVAIYES